MNKTFVKIDRIILLKQRVIIQEKIYLNKLTSLSSNFDSSLTMTVPNNPAIKHTSGIIAI